ncbi:hypothetical protein IF2G_06412 [Cordyceps javanica]|nr:hypothetical protein IF2G_06412 [Cordyceps javanica]
MPNGKRSDRTKPAGACVTCKSAPSRGGFSHMLAQSDEVVKFPSCSLPFLTGVHGKSFLPQFGASIFAALLIQAKGSGRQVAAQPQSRDTGTVAFSA